MVSAIIICISAFVSDPDGQTIERAAHARGWASYHMLHTDSATEQNCSMVVVRGDSFTTHATYATFDDRGAPVNYRYRALSRARAADLLTAWTAQASFKAIADAAVCSERMM